MSPSRLHRSERYRTKRRGIRGSRATALDYAEGDIADDPTHMKWRRRTEAGHVLDFYAANDGLLIEFYVMGAEDVCLDDLHDLADPPIRR